MSDRFLHIDTQSLKSQIGELFADFPELAEDDELRLDTLEGETDFHRVMERIFREYQEANEMVSGIKERASTLADRKSRYERKCAAMRKLAMSVMEAAKAEKVTLPEATLSLRDPMTSVEVNDVEALPQGYFHTERKADKKAIKAALENGEQIPGAELAWGEPGLTIRTK